VSGEGDAAIWEVTGRVENTGTGTMPVEVAAMTGERFPDGEEEEPDAEGAEPDLAALGPVAAAADERDPGAGERFEEARTGLSLAAGESAEFRILCPFDPDRVVVDPDVLVLQLNRNLAIHRF
jgi:hypothetical protein